MLETESDPRRAHHPAAAIMPMGPPSDIPAPTSLLGVSRALIEDPQAKAAFDADPDGWMADRGFGGLDPAAAAVALDHVADALPPALAAALSEGRQATTEASTPFAAAAAIDPDTAVARWAERVALGDAATRDPAVDDASGTGPVDPSDPGTDPLLDPMDLESSQSSSSVADQEPPPATSDDGDPTALDIGTEINDPEVLDALTKAPVMATSPPADDRIDPEVASSTPPDGELVDFGRGSPGGAAVEKSETDRPTPSPLEADLDDPAAAPDAPQWSEGAEPPVEPAAGPGASADPATLDDGPKTGDDWEQSEAFDPGI